jgi:His/Glu/Gln/Arg/opine family amino acid ABC transporter permease subunit
MDFDINIILKYWPIIFEGLTLTLFICVIALPIGLILSTGVCAIRMSQNWILKSLSIAFIEVIRNTPFLIQIFLVFYVLPFYGIRTKPIIAGICCLSIYASAYFAEIIRGAILSVPKNQNEAAQALGVTPKQVLRKVIFPQMLGYLIPPMTNMGITIIKESSVLSIITVAELTYYSQFVIGKAFAPVEIFSLVGLIYWIITALFALGMRIIENRYDFIARIENANVSIPHSG